MARRTDDWCELKVQHEDELRDSREYVARLVDFGESREGGLLKLGATTGTQAQR